MRTFRKWGSDVVVEDVTLLHNAVDKACVLEDLVGSYITIYKNVGLMHAKRVGRDINAHTKAFDPESFAAMFEKAVAEFMYGKGFNRIMLMRQTFMEFLVDMLQSQVTFGDSPSPSTLTDWIQSIVQSPQFYRWQAMRIARTESTAASNYGAMKSAEEFGYAMTKEWMSAHDSRTRRKPDDEYDHRQMDGKKVNYEEPFEFHSKEGVVDKIMFPGDPQGHAGNVINCRCTVSLRPRRDKEGNLIRL